jgi:hypothetical protein
LAKLSVEQREAMLLVAAEGVPSEEAAPSAWDEVATMQLMAQERPALITGTGGAEGDTKPSPPGAERVANLFEIVGIGIFLALRAGAIVILIRRRRGS